MTNENLIHVTNENFESDIMSPNSLVIVDFWAEWCGPCKMMGPVFAETAKDYNGKLLFAKLNTETEPELAAKFNIMGIPSLVILKGGKEVDRIVGFMPKEALKQKIDAILATI